LPSPIDSVTEGGRKFYIFQLPAGYVFNAAGDYVIPVTITDLQIENCSYSVQTSITVKVIAGPGTDFTLSANTCVQDSIIFTGSSSANVAWNRWFWNFDNGQTDSIQQVKIAYAGAGIYNVSLLLVRSDDGCTAKRSKAIQINALPQAMFHLPTQPVCLPGGSVQLLNQSMPGQAGEVLSYSWDLGDGNTSAAISPVHYYQTAGNYSIRLITTSVYGCKDTADQSFGNFAPKPGASFIPDISAACFGQTVTFSDQSQGANPQQAWFVNNIPASTGSSYTYSATAPGRDDVTLIVQDANGCKDTASYMLDTWPLPIADAGQDEAIARGNTVQLNGSTNAATNQVAWSPAYLLTMPTLLNPYTTPLKDQLYKLAITDQHGCTASDSVFIKVYQPIDIPNAFSPNGDGLHDRWVIGYLNDYPGATVQVYNRYGQEVFTSKGAGKYWDGTLNGSAFDLHADFGNSRRHSGYVTILR
jgi:gliding motility-associated-like protein